jgi:uncharacterized protein
MKNKQGELIAQLSDKDLQYSLFFTQIILLTISGILGIFLFEDVQSFFDLFKLKDRNIFFVGGIAGILVVLMDIMFMVLLPPSYQDDGGINERIFKNLSYPMIFAVAVTVALTEEILFRGVIQTHFGLIWASFIFAIVHYRYLFNWFLFLNVTLLSFLMGVIFHATDNLLVTIFMHFIIDFILGIIVKNRGIRKA